MLSFSKYSFLLLTLLAEVALHGQSFSSVNYTEKEGLASSTVYNITEDKDGYLWFATENGLSRFDGAKFKNFTTKEGLPDNSILRVHGARDGRIYFLPFTHTLYYYQNDSIYRFPVPEKYKDEISNASHFSNSTEGVLIGAKLGYLIRRDTLLPLSKAYPILGIDVQISWTYDTLITGRWEDSICFISQNGDVEKRLFPQRSENVIYSRNRTLVQLSPDKQYVISLGDFANSEGTIFFFYKENHVHFFVSETGQFLYKIKIEKFSDAFIDSEGNLWIATLGNGVYRFLPFSFKQVKDEPDGIYSIIQWNKKIYAGSDMSKLHTFENNTGLTDGSIINLSHYIKLAENPVSHMSKRNRIYTLFRNDTSLFIGTDAFLLKKSRGPAQLFSKIFPIKDIDLVDQKLLVSTGRSVLLLNPETLTIRDSILKQRATCGVIYKGDYYIGTIGGLVKVNGADKSVVELYKKFSNFRGRITAIKKGNNDDLWIASNGHGLILFKNNKVIKTISEKNGITSDICTSIFIDSGTVWLGTTTGLNRIENASGNEKITRITSANGLPSDFINSIYVTGEKVYVGTAKGLTCFGKKTLIERSICVLHIQNVLNNGVKLKKSNSYSFPYNTLNIQINFTAISFKSAGDITYYYKLQGLEDNWNLTTNNFVNFATLPHGNYTFLLKATNKFGVTSAVQSIDIIIRPAWWQTWFFKISAVLLIIAISFLIYKKEIHRYQKKQEEKRAIEVRYAELEQQALLAQMNPHFIFNCLNSIQSFVIEHDVIGANRYIAAFSSLIRQTLENSSSPFISIAAEIKYLSTYLQLEQLRFKDKFTYSINVEQSILQQSVYLPSMLLQPYVENALRHGIQHRKDNLGHISIEVIACSGSNIIYVIKDNGVGREMAEKMKSKNHIEYQSRGTGISANRISSINYQYKENISITTTDIFENGLVAGTSVEISIPDFNSHA